MKQRKEFLHYFFKGLQPFQYAILKDIYKDIYELPESADVDLVIDKKDLPAILDMIRKGEHVMHIKIENKGFACFASVFFDDMGYLEIDLIHRFERKGIIYMSSGKLLNSTTVNQQGLRTASLHHQFEYILLFYYLNSSQIPARYQEYFSSFSSEKRKEVLKHITHQYGLSINSLEDLYTYHVWHHNRLLHKIYNYGANKQWNYFWHKTGYLVDFLREKWQDKGITITFSGVDGAGKSTVLKKVQDILEKKYHKNVKVFRHRPSLLPILSSLKYGKKNAEQRATVTLPRQGKNNNRISSILRFLYYYSDYLIGQVYIFFRYKIRGTTILYDRYYFDFIVDGRRSNISISPSFIRLGYRFISKPKLNFFLYAPANEILSRKQELSASDIRTMTDEYLHLFLDFSGAYKNQEYVAINNIDIDSTIETVTKQIINIQK